MSTRKIGFGRETIDSECHYSLFNLELCPFTLSLVFTTLRNRLLITLWEKEKMLVTSIFSFSHNVFFFPIWDRNCYLSNIKFVVCKWLSFQTSLKFSCLVGVDKQPPINLTLHQMTIFGLDWIKSICRRQIKCCYNYDLFMMGGKHCGRGRKCWFLGVIKSLDCVVNGEEFNSSMEETVSWAFFTLYCKQNLILSQTRPSFYVPAEQVFRKRCGKRLNCS